ncbi:YHYH protein [Marivita geojedonensis]|uniref:YHYH protein n=1 Tax=Marivita geojedonensis TaxID=1123756 RepID=UPI000A1F01C9|nr:YHYH protein [Marivita geojedonensis]
MPAFFASCSYFRKKTENFDFSARVSDGVLPLVRFIYVDGPTNGPPRSINLFCANTKRDHMTIGKNAKKSRIFRRLGISFQTAAISGLSVFAAFVDPASAHEDITNAILTDRAANCTAYADTYSAQATDVQNAREFDASVSISVSGDHCSITSNAVPNHDFNATGRFVTPLSEQNQAYSVPANPTLAAQPTALSLQYDNAVFLNGVKLDLLAAGCFGVGNGRIGCNDMTAPYRYDPMAPGAGFGADEHNAHTQPDGAYHYHGNPMALFEQENPTSASPVIGFAADGFPIFGIYIDDGGTIRKATSSYRLKIGTRPGGPGGTYDGTFVDDWEYVDGYGDLDRCNGMTQDGVYGYVVTETYPHVMACFSGTPDSSFMKRRP